MKKPICLLLVIIIMCSTMVSCTKSEDIPYICYTADESLTTFDIEFLSTSPQVFQEVRHSKHNLGSIPQTNQALKGWGDEPYPLLWIQKDLDSARYLCLYTYEDAFKSLLVTIDRIFNTKLSAKYFVWYRFDCDIADIPLEMDGKSLLNSFFICDSVIKKDLISGTEYNINSTFYLQLGPDPVQLKTYYPFLVAWENLLYWRSAIETDDLVNDSQHIFFTEYAGDKKSDWGYDGARVVMLDACKHEPQEETVTLINDITITYYDANRLYVYKYGFLFSLESALERKIISEEDLLDIAANYNASVSSFLDVCDKHDFEVGKADLSAYDADNVHIRPDAIMITFDKKILVGGKVDEKEHLIEYINSHFDSAIVTEIGLHIEETAEYKLFKVFINNNELENLPTIMNELASVPGLLEISCYSRRLYPTI